MLSIDRVSICAVTDAASCPLSWQLFLPAAWDDAEAATAEAAAAIRARRARAGIPDEARHREKWRLALDMLDELAGWEPPPPAVVSDAGYGTTAEFRDELTARGWTYVCQVNGDLTAHPADAVPERIDCSGRGPRPKLRYRPRPVGLREHVLARFGKSYVGDPDQLAEELAKDAAVREADTLLLTVPSMLGVDHNARLLETITQYVAPAIGWVPPAQRAAAG